jgi:hypothetical protein
MAKASKQRPWVIEMSVKSIPGWFEMDAYRDDVEARMQASLMQRRSPEADFRVRNVMAGDGSRLEATSAPILTDAGIPLRRS